MDSFLAFYGAIKGLIYKKYPNLGSKETIYFVVKPKSKSKVSNLKSWGFGLRLTKSKVSSLKSQAFGLRLTIKSKRATTTTHPTTLNSFLKLLSLQKLNVELLTQLRINSSENKQQWCIQIWPQPMRGGQTGIYCRKLENFHTFFFLWRLPLIHFWGLHNTYRVSQKECYFC